MLNETREVKATLTAEKGRVIAWTNDKEAKRISIATANDRAVMTPTQARELAAWLTRVARELDGTGSATAYGEFRPAGNRF
jgi:hypothetical protein